MIFRKPCSRSGNRIAGGRHENLRSLTAFIGIVITLAALLPSCDKKNRANINDNKHPRPLREVVHIKPIEPISGMAWANHVSALRKQVENTINELSTSELKSADSDQVPASLRLLIEKEGVAAVAAIADYIAARSNSPSSVMAHDHALLVYIGTMLSEVYSSGKLGDMSAIIGAINQETDTKFGAKYKLVYYMLLTLAKSSEKQTIVRSFEEIFHGSARQDQNLDEISVAAAGFMGYENALSIIPSDEKFGRGAIENATYAIIEKWMNEDSIKCSAFIRDCPPGRKREYYIECLVNNLGRTGFFDDAESWYKLIPEGSASAINAREAIDSSKERKGIKN